MKRSLYLPIIPVLLVAVWFAPLVGISPLVSSSTLQAAEPQAARLWPEGAPNAVGNTLEDQPTIFIHRPKTTNATETAVIVCPGGGYGGLAMSYEGHEVAEWFNSMGVTGVVLRYRHAPRYHHPAPLQDVERAVRYVRAHAAELGVKTDRIGVMGFSAGGHLTASAGTLYSSGNTQSADPVERVSSRPDFLVLAYPVITMEDPYTHKGSRRNLLGSDNTKSNIRKLSLEHQVNAETPPAFLFHTGTDTAVPVENSILFYSALRRNGVPAELHVYREGPHGVGLKRHKSTAGWPGQLKSWMQHLGLLQRRPQATRAEDLTLLPGFKAELLYSVPKQEQGSWINLTVDDRGRLITSAQRGPLYRITPPPPGKTLAPSQVEEIQLEIGGAHGLLHAFGSIYAVRGEKDQGLYRVVDTNGDDQYDEVRLLRKLGGGGEHGPHAVILSPDGRSLYVVGGNHTKVPDPETSVVPLVWDEDLLLPRLWDATGHARGIMAPGGWIARTDPEGKSWELVSNGYRNEFDIAFNSNGDLFTFDADMEWDIGTPWYRPTRINHATSGSEFGWRSGTGKWPEYYPDSLDAVVDIGPGSPTGIAFGYGARFPEKYQRALFVCDWSYGKMYAVHLSPDGATWKGEVEQFATASPLPLTDVIIRPQDGAMYITTGGRGMQSGIYRITHEGDFPAKNIHETRTPEARIRRRLESLHGKQDSNTVATAWPYLAHDDRFVRYAARIAIEHQPVTTWTERALNETDPTASIEAVVALARHGDDSLRDQALNALSRIDFSSLAEAEQLALLRAYALTFIRMGKPPTESAERIAGQFNSYYPAPSHDLNRELSQILVYLEAPDVVTKTLALMNAAPNQEEQMHFALVLSSLPDGWTLDQRRTYFEWFQGATGYRGGHSFLGFVRDIKKAAVATLSEQEKQALAAVLADKKATLLAELPQPKGPGKKWTLDEVAALTETSLSQRDFENGRRMFGAGQCANCHRFAGNGGAMGPDLTGIAGRFNRRDLVETIVEPSKVISDQYQATVFVLDDGNVVTGRVVNMGGGNMTVNTDMLNPDQGVRVNPERVLQTTRSDVSMMPANLLDRLNQNEVLDLLAYLLSRGDRKNPIFRQ